MIPWWLCCNLFEYFVGRETERLMSSNWSARYFPQHSSFATWRLRLFPTWNEMPLMGRIIVLWWATSPTPTLGRDDFSCRSPKQVAVICFDTSNMYQAFAFYRTRVRSLAMLVTNSLTDSLTNSCLVYLIDVGLACEDGKSKLVEDVDDEKLLL